MKKFSLSNLTTGLIGGTVFLTAFTGCDTDDTTRHDRHRDRDRDRVNVYGQGSVTYEDDYDYYPGYEVYYSRNRQEYVYRDGGQWVRRREPSGIRLDVLLASPSVRVDFRDSPERHHDNVVRRYPRHWNRQSDHDRVNVHGQASVNFEDDYDYYPGYEVYYSRSRQEYVYRNGNQWVRSREPSGIRLDVLRASPSVRVDFRDSPERHHDNVVRRYPRNWKHQNDRHERRNDDRDDRDNRRDGRR